MGACKVVPVPHDDFAAPTTHGTKVILPDGAELKRVQAITLHCATNDIWRATIECAVDPPDVSCIATIIYKPRLTWWRRVLLRMAGVREVETSNTDSEFREFVPVTLSKRKGNAKRS